ncbi:MAG: sulfur carrier protein [Haloarculaceae archaeon]|jgi:sulfur carrier protein
MVTVELVGGETHEMAVDGETTYADLLAPFDVSRHEVSLVVDGRPVPEDAPVEESVERVRVVRLIQGGSRATTVSGRPRRICPRKS